MGAIPVYAAKAVLNVYRGFRSVLGTPDEGAAWILERPPQLEPQTTIEDTMIQVINRERWGVSCSWLLCSGLAVVGAQMRETFGGAGQAQGSESPRGRGSGQELRHRPVRVLRSQNCIGSDC